MSRWLVVNATATVMLPVPAGVSDDEAKALAGDLVGDLRLVHCDGEEGPSGLVTAVGGVESAWLATPPTPKMGP